MNQKLQSKINELENAYKYECWYLVKQPTAFDCLCYLVSFLKEYKETQTTKNLQGFIEEKIEEINSTKQTLNISNNYRALRVAAFFGLIILTSSKYDEATLTDTYKEIYRRCNGEFEKTDLYNDIIQRQIEKMFISSEIDEEYQGARKEYRLFPVMLLYKILLELGRATGKYSISMTEYKYIVATTKSFNLFLESLMLIQLLREDKTNAIKNFEQYKDKFDNRLIQALKQLDTLTIDNNSIIIKNDKLEEVAKKVFLFEKNPNVFTSGNYIEFLGSTRSLFDLDQLNNTINSDSFLNLEFNTKYKSDFAKNRILFGAPGTGKSYTLNNELQILLGTNNEDDYERVTFHPDYSYANFVGTYKPVMIEESFENITEIEEKDVVSILTDKSMSSQEKYDLLYDKFKEDGLTRLPLLLGLYTDDSFHTRKADGTKSIGDNIVERNHGKSIRPYVNLSKLTSKKKDISYEYVPGPFLRVLVKALKNAASDNPRPFVLIIEEINRANVAAVFGDIFQLLDRDSHGVSKYKISTTYDMRKYLSEQLEISESKVESIKIPNNMFIWATMNSADQGVFPIDTAFKRRWDFTYLGIDDNDEKIRGKFVYLSNNKSQKIEWNKLRKAINNFLAKNKINEDKQLGPYFISENIVIPEQGDEINREVFINTFKNKVIMYLFEDAAKQKRSKLFEGCSQNSTRYSLICKEFEEHGIKIFNQEIILECEIKDIESEYDNSDN